MTVQDAIEQAYRNGYENGKRDAVVHGRCVYVRDDELTDHWECSVCNKYIPSEYLLAWNYCPNCGAKMDEPPKGE